MADLKKQMDGATDEKKAQLQALWREFNDKAEAAETNAKRNQQWGTDYVHMKGKGDKGGAGPQRDQSGTLDRAMADAERNLKYLEAQGSRP